jgi:maleamate amidohydrolase
MKTTFSLDLDRTALLLIDFQEEQRSHPLYAVAGFPDVVANATRLLEAARVARCPLIHAAFRRDFTQRPPRPFEPMSDSGAPAFSDVADPMTEICKEVAPLSSESVLHKNDASAFCEGTLEPILAQGRIEWLIIGGVWTEACVAATIRDAIALGRHVLLVKDACGSGTAAMHQTAVLNIANRLYGGAVTDTDRAMRLLAGETAEVWRPERPVPILFDYATAAKHYDAL